MAFLGLVLVAAAGVAALTASAKPLGINGQIVYGHDNGVFVVNPNGSDRRLIHTDTCCASWSPDGSHIAFAASTNDSRITTATISADGSGYTLLPLPDSTLNLGPGSEDSWSPDGQRLLLQGWDNTDASRNGVYTSALNGSGLVQVTTGNDVPADFSPDGTRIAFFRQNGPKSFALFVVGVNGGAVHQISGWQPDMGTASWSPDGRWILTDNGQGSLYVLHPNGTNRHRISLAISNDYAAFTPGWSPDGKKIVFGLARSTGQGGIYTADINGSDVKQVTIDVHGLHDDTPDWGTHALTPCVVPKLKGKTLAGAKRSINKADCALGQINKQYSATVEAGRVISQKPKPHLTRPAGSKIALLVSHGRKGH
jgi:dipeptidyl aminopeptidase/acylaminoacyl peptidase